MPYTAKMLHLQLISSQELGYISNFETAGIKINQFYRNIFPLFTNVKSFPLNLQFKFDKHASKQ